MTFVLFFVVSLESSIGNNETTMSLRHRVIDSIIVGSPHPTQLRKDLKEASYPDSIWSMIEKRLPHEVLKRDKSGVYHLLDEDGKVMPGLRLVYHSDSAQLTALERRFDKEKEVKWVSPFERHKLTPPPPPPETGRAWRISFLHTNVPNEIVHKLRKTFPSFRILRRSKSIPPPYFLLKGEKIFLTPNLPTGHHDDFDRFYSRIKTLKQTFTEHTELKEGNFRVRLFFRDAPITLKCTRIDRIRDPGLGEQHYVTVQNDVFQGDFVFQRLPGQHNFHFLSASLQILTRAEQRELSWYEEETRVYSMMYHQ